MTKFLISKKLIKDGCPKHSENCPAANCINEKLKKNYYTSVSQRMVIILDLNDIVFCELIPPPRELHDWILAYDAGLIMNELEFELPVPEEYLK